MDALLASVVDHVAALCSVTGDRRPGGPGNREASTYIRQAMETKGWTVLVQEFECLDWVGGESSISVGGATVAIEPSPYGCGVNGLGPLRVVSREEDLHRPNLAGSVLVVTEPLSREPLTPKNYPFYASADHTRIIEALEAADPAAIVAVTGKYPTVCGALDPFPWIEDGDLPIPVASTRPADAGPLLVSDGLAASVRIEAERRPARAHNVAARRGPASPRITVIAHLDTKPGTPGAVDNATGVTVLLLLAGLLERAHHAAPPIGVELLAVNGEDHYAAPGEVAWLNAQEDLDDIVLAVNVDGAGFRVGGTHYSTYNLDGAIARHVEQALEGTSSITRGPEWYQSDHAIFAIQGRPAVAFTSADMDRLLSEVYHAPTDTPAMVDPTTVADLAAALAHVIRTWPDAPSTEA